MMDNFEQFQNYLLRRKLYRIVRRCIKVFLIALFILEIGGIVLFSAKYGFSHYLGNFWEIQYFVFELQFSRFFWILLAGDLIFGGFLSYIQQEDLLVQQNSSVEEKRILSSTEYFQREQSKQTTLAVTKKRSEMNKTPFIKKD